MRAFAETKLKGVEPAFRFGGEATPLRPIKIVHCLPDEEWITQIQCEHPQDAAFIQQKYIAEGLEAQGNLITFMAPRGLDDVVYSCVQAAVKVAPRTWTSTGWFSFLGKVVWKLQQILGIPYLNVFSNYRRLDAYERALQGYDLVLERNSFYNVATARACKKLGLPYLLFFDADQILEQEFMGRPLRGWLLWRARHLLRENLAAAHRVICVSDAAKAHLMMAWNVPQERIVVLPNAVDIERFHPDPDLRAKTRASLALTTHPLLIFVGSFYPWHDIRSLLEAFVLVLRTNAEARLLLVGDGSERRKMMEYAEELGIGKAVHFTGFVAHTEVSAFLNAADIAVVPIPAMKQNMWLSPMKLFEYMAAGKAVVASAAGQVRHVVKNGQNGLLVPAGNVEALANAIQTLIDNPAIRDWLARHAREDAVENHSWESYIARLEQVFASVLS